MKNLPNALVTVAILFIIYAVIGKLIGYRFISFGIVKAYPVTIFALANSLMLIAVFLKLSK